MRTGRPGAAVLAGFSDGAGSKPRGRVLAVLPVTLLLVLSFVYKARDAMREGTLDGNRSASGQQLSGAVTFAGETLTTPDGAGSTEPGNGPWSSLQRYESVMDELPPGSRLSDLRQTFHVARNVMVSREHLVYVSDQDSPDQVDVPTTLPWTWGKRTERGIVYVDQLNATATSNPLRNCEGWVNKPAFWFHLADHENFFHYLNDALLLVLATLNDTGLTPAHMLRVFDAAERRDPAVEMCLLPDTNDIMLMSEPDGMRFPWRFLFDMISYEHRVPAEVVGLCFKTLVVGASCSLDFRLRRPSQPALLRKFQVFAFRAALTHRVILMPATPIAARRDYARRECAFLAAAGQTPAPGSWHSGDALPRVTYAVRRPPGSRAVRNEDDIVAAIRERYDVDLVLTTFGGSLYDSMKLMQTTDLFLGMHGAGFTNVLFLPPGATVLQMFPFGWTAPDGKMHREELYSNMVEAANCTYHRWANKRWYLAHLRREDFMITHPEDVTGSGYEEHPTPEMADPKWDQWEGTPLWSDQGTTVDMDDFIPVLEAAFDSARIPRRSPGTAEPIADYFLSDQRRT